MKQITIYDVIQVNELPTPIIEKDDAYEAICPFCGKTFDEYKKGDSTRNMSEFYMSAVSLVASHVQKDKCNTPQLNFIMKHVSVKFSFDSIQETCKALGISLTRKEDDSIKRL